MMGYFFIFEVRVEILIQTPKLTSMQVDLSAGLDVHFKNKKTDQNMNFNTYFKTKKMTLTWTLMWTSK